MADDNKLHIEISAGVEDLKKGLKEAEKDVGKFGNETEKTLEKTSKSTKKLENGIKVSSQAMSELDQHTKGLGSSFIKVGQAAKVGGAAMKTALISTGIGVLVVGLALVIAHWDDIQKFVNKYGEALKEADKTLDRLSRKTQIINNHLKLIESELKLAKVQGETQEKILEVEKKIRLSKQLSLNTELQSAKARLSLLSLAALELSFAEKLANVVRIAQGYGPIMPSIDDDERKAIRDAADGINSLEIAINNNAAALTVLYTPAIKKAKDETKDLKTETDELTETISSFAKTYSQLNLLGVFGEVPEFVKQTNAYSQSFRAMSVAANEYNDSAPDFLKMPKLDPETIVENEEILINHLDYMGDLMQNFVDNLRGLIQENLINAFSGIGEAIGSALAQGESVVNAIGESLINSFGAFLSDMGKLLITYGTLAVTKGLLDIAVQQSGNPYVAIAAGAAAIAVGIAMTAAGAAFANKPGSSSGGSRGVSGGGSSSGGFSGSRTSGSGSGIGGGTYVFEIEGTKLVGVLSNTLSRNRALGGSLGIT